MGRKRINHQDETMVRKGNVDVDDEIVEGEGLVTFEGTANRAAPPRDGVTARATDAVPVETVAVPAATPVRAAAEPIPSMTSDNTDTALETTGSMMADSAASAVINRVRRGMTVVDANGEELGSIEEVKMGDPGAATVGGDVPADPGLIAAFFGGVEPDLPEALRARLLRFGYVKVDGKGWIDTDRYIVADQIGNVSGDTVTLTVAKERLMEEY